MWGRGENGGNPRRRKKKRASDARHDGVAFTRGDQRRRRRRPRATAPEDNRACWRRATAVSSACVARGMRERPTSLNYSCREDPIENMISEPKIQPEFERRHLG
ncbi:hypothetical protein Scep_030440 [Stephania cephalantha]|uniref:Uncharacterized protein n=1 Tax=Stephania cephalantha TaxID=152367 RepID=A0AAP0HEC7_9MAGN